MRPNHLLVVSSGLILALLSVSPAMADTRGQHTRGRDAGRAAAAPRAEAPRAAAPQARPNIRSAPPVRTYNRGPAPMQRAVPRPELGVAPRVVGPSVVAPRNYGSRSYGSGGYVYPRYGNRGYGNRGYGNRGYGYGGYRYGGYGYGGYGYRGRFIVPVVPYYRPYYAFRPHFSIGFGLFVGYPVPYPYYFGAPSYVYPYPAYPPYSQPYGYDPNYDPNYPPAAPYGAPPEYGASVGPPPAQGSYGGISFEITPDDAAIYVDGTYVGVVRDFSPTHQPLTLTPGAHHIELQAQGCAPLTFDATIASGQVIPYRGALQPY